MEALYMNMYMGNDSLTQVSIYRYSRIDKNIDKGRDKDKDRDRGGNGYKDMHIAYDSMSDLGEIRVYQRADFQSGSRVLKKVF